MGTTKVIGVFLLYTILLHVKVKAKEITLLDTRNEKSVLGWSRYPTTRHGWTEMVYTDENDVDCSAYRVCSVTTPNQNNWLRTPHLPVGNVKRLYVEIGFVFLPCAIELNLSLQVVTCKDKFNVYYLESDEQDDNLADSMNKKTYKKLRRIKMTANYATSNKAIKKIKVRRISSKGIYVAIQDVGACMAILHVKVYYKLSA